MIFVESRVCFNLFNFVSISVFVQLDLMTKCTCSFCQSTFHCLCESYSPVASNKMANIWTCLIPLCLIWEVFVPEFKAHCFWAWNITDHIGYFCSSYFRGRLFNVNIAGESQRALIDRLFGCRVCLVRLVKYLTLPELFRHYFVLSMYFLLF